MADFGTLNLDEEAKNKGRVTSGSKNAQISSNRYTIVDNNFEDDEKEDEDDIINDKVVINTSNNLEENNKTENIKEHKRVSRESNKIKKNLIQMKIILLGNISVGKTCIARRYVNNTFSEAYNSTIQAEQRTKIINEDDDTQIKLNIWDTVGQEKFRAITRQFYRDALGAIIIFDLTDKSSFDSVKNWISDLKTNGSDDTVIIILGNKLDLSGERIVTQEEIKESFGNDYPYYDVSAKNGNNISLAFDKLKKLIMENLKTKEKSEGIGINDINIVKKKSLSTNKRTQSLSDNYKKIKEKDKKCC